MNDFLKNLIEKSKFFGRNTTPKIVSIIFALVMWLYVMGEVNPEMVKDFTNVKVQLLNVEELNHSGLVLIGQEDYTVNLKIGGRRNDVIHISPQDITISADLRGFRKGVNSVPLDISAPASIKIQDISPKQLKITLDEVVKRQKPVVIETVGIPPQGFDPGEATISLKEVIVEGPETLVNNVARVVGEVNFQDKAEDFTGKIPLKAVNQEGKTVNGVEVKSKYVDVTLPLYSLKDVRISLDLEGKLPEGYEMTQLALKPEFVTIKGPKDLVDSITEIKTKPILMDGLRGSTEKVVELIVPDGVNLFKSDKNPVAAITVEEMAAKEISYGADEIQIDNLDVKYTVSFPGEPNIIRVRVEGPKSMISELSKNDVILHVNAKDLGSGSHLLRILPMAEKKIDRMSVSPEKIEIEIKQSKDTNLH